MKHYKSHRPRRAPAASGQAKHDHGSSIETLEPRLLLSTVTSLTIKELDGVTTPNYPVMISMPFKDGDVTGNYVTVKVDGTAVATQTDVKNRYDDGSVKFALISFEIPQLGANQTVTIDLDSAGVNHNTGYLTVAQLLASDFGVQMTVTAAGAPTTTIDARSLLASQPNPEYWMQGDVASQILIKDLNTNVPNAIGTAQLNVQYYVTQFAGWNGYCVETVVENDWSASIQNYTYDFNLQLGGSNPQSVLSKTAFKQNAMSRWHETYWVGQKPSNIQVSYDMDYLVAGGFIPNYDQSLAPTPTIIQQDVSAWQKKDSDLGSGTGLYTPGFPTTGGRAEIGIYPTWTLEYLLSMDARERDIMLSSADISGYIPYHLRESDPARPNYQHVLDANNRPTLWLPNWVPSGVTTTEHDKLTPIGDYANVWHVDNAHQGSFDYVPYLVTGDYYYMEEMVFLAAYDSNSFSSWGGKPPGVIMDQERGNAWVIRNLADAAAMTPDNMTVEKVNITDKVDRTLAYWQKNAQTYTGAFHQVMVGTSAAPWQEDFLLISLAHVKSMGFNADWMFNWIGDTLVNRFENADYNPYRSSGYWEPTGNASGPYTTWKQLDKAWGAEVTSLAVTNYNYGSLGALSYVLDKPGGMWAYEWLRSYIKTSRELNDFNFAILPLDSSGAVKDTIAPSVATNLAVLDTTDLTATLHWTMSGDDGSTGLAQYCEVRYSTSPITDDTTWAAALPVTGIPTEDNPVTTASMAWRPGENKWLTTANPGSTQEMVVDGLQGSTQYYFAVRVTDNARNTSAVSNSASGTTTISPPLVADVAFSGATVGNPDVGSNTFTVTVTYSEPMNTSIAPVITFSQDVSSTLTFSSGAWVDSTHYAAAYNVADAGVTAADIGVTVSGAQNPSTVLQRARSFASKFGIDMVDPTVSLLRDGLSVTLLASDVGLGLSGIQYQISGGAWLTYAAPFNILAGDIVNYYSEDVAGNVSETKSLATRLVGGDANRDGLVNVVDLGVLAKNYDMQSGATWAMADFSADGKVDVVDLGVLAKFYDYGVLVPVVVNFDATTDPALFVKGVTSWTRVAGHGGYMGQMTTGNAPGTVMYQPGGIVTPIGNGTFSSDVNLKRNTSQTGGTYQIGLLVGQKSGMERYGALLTATANKITLTVGCLDNWGGSAASHTAVASLQVGTYVNTDSDLGWYNINAVVSTTNIDQRKIVVTLTKPDTTTVTLTYIDSGANRYTTPYPAGYIAYSQWTQQINVDHFIMPNPAQMGMDDALGAEVTSLSAPLSPTGAAPTLVAADGIVDVVSDASTGVTPPATPISPSGKPIPMLPLDLLAVAAAPNPVVVAQAVVADPVATRAAAGFGEELNLLSLNNLGL